MANNSKQPRKDDVVLGGQNSTPADGVVLGGLEGVKRRLENPAVEQRILALEEALKYGETGLELVIQALQDQFWKVRTAAYLLLEEQANPRVKKILREHASAENRLNRFVAKGRRGKASDIDSLMAALEKEQNISTYKLVDYTLGLVETPQGKERIKYYLFQGTSMQRNYAALYFKRLGEKDILTEAVQLGCIDRLQAFSK